ncbi:ThiF family adenylyltransferase [Kitasatospora herbaricolor]|uniref:ThiF family adenylyltransferase n=1 Tax=Kitasatospora herbaricolor TaxID=68217 RepID=UPI0036D97BD6
MRRPRIKPEHTAYRTTAGNVRIGGLVHGIGAEIEDPAGWVWTLTTLTDGTRPPDEIAQAVSARHPAVGSAQVADALVRLTEAGFLEEADAPPPPALSRRERERYSRGVGLLRWMDTTPRRSSWDVQLLLRDAAVLVVGLGGTGGTLALALAASGVGRLHCVDFDTVDLSNLNRQTLFTESDLGRPKAEAAAVRLRAANTDITVTAEHRRITGPADLTALLGAGRTRYGLLALCADRPAGIRRWANQACLATGVPWVDGGYHGPLATAGLYRPGDGACWECLHTAEREGRDLGLAPGADTPALPATPWNPVNAVTAGLSGALMAHAALSLLTGVPRPVPGRRFGINLMLPGEPVLEDSPRRPDCPACGDRPAGPGR